MHSSDNTGTGHQNVVFFEFLAGQIEKPNWPPEKSWWSASLSHAPFFLNWVKKFSLFSRRSQITDE